MSRGDGKKPAMNERPREQVSRQYSTPALEKGLDILELFVDEPGGLSKSDVARRLGRTVPEIFRMLLCLETRGYISQARNDELYRLTLHLFKLAQEHPPTKRIITEALPILQNVAQETTQSCHLGVLERGNVAIVAHVDSHASTGFFVKTGSIIDLMHSATGHVILAHQSPEACSRAIKTWHEQTGERPPGDLSAHLTQIRNQGYEERASYEVDGVTNISFPILDRRGNAIAALTVPFLQRIGDQTTTETVRGVLRRATQLLSQALDNTVSERAEASMPNRSARDTVTSRLGQNGRMMKRNEIERRYTTPALEKGLDALELFASESDGLTKAEVARRLGRTVSEVFRVLICLEKRGYIARFGDDERCSLTLQLFRLACSHPPIERLAAEALPIMGKVACQTRQSCHLGVLDGDRVVIIAQVNASQNSGFYVKAGGIGDLMRSTTGQVILAHQTMEASSRAISLWCKHNGSSPPRDLPRQLSRIRERGFDQRQSYEVEGVINISFPVLDDRGCAVAAISVPFLQRIGDSTTSDAVVEVLRKASCTVSQAIGGMTNRDIHGS
jgi:DNA-binding IclR family transcriptional regulator